MKEFKQAIKKWLDIRTKDVHTIYPDGSVNQENKNTELNNLQNNVKDLIFVHDNLAEKTKTSFKNLRELLGIERIIDGDGEEIYVFIKKNKKKSIKRNKRNK